jgi:hypothetical protein
VGDERLPFDDRKVVRELLSSEESGVGASAVQ